MPYDLIIIGAGAAGLFAGASLTSPVNGLILEKKAAPGRKLLLTGSGQCNLTHGGSIKDFIPHYGKSGPPLRSVLYRFNNLSVVDFFESNGIPLMEREDQKIFPKSMKAEDILNALTARCTKNGLQFLYSSAVDQITITAGQPSADETASTDSILYGVHCKDKSYETRKLIIATGGCSYPATGSDGSFFAAIRQMGIEIIELAPALVPVYVDSYPYKSLSGISFQSAEVTVNTIKNRDALLLTHNGFSGPAVLNLSRHARTGDSIIINYFPVKPEEAVVKELSRFISGNNKQLLSALSEYFNSDTKDSPGGLPKRFLEIICSRADIDCTEKASRISMVQLKSIVRLISHDEYKILKLGGFESAMVTAGGVALSEINTKTMESIKYPGIFFAGEVLDVDGDTGGYNLQFAFSSGWAAARS